MWKSQKNDATQGESQNRVFFFLDGMEVKKQDTWLAHVSGWSRTRRTSCVHVVWKIVLVRRWVLIRECRARKTCSQHHCDSLSVAWKSEVRWCSSRGVKEYERHFTNVKKEALSLFCLPELLRHFSFSHGGTPSPLCILSLAVLTWREIVAAKGWSEEKCLV